MLRIITIFLLNAISLICIGQHDSTSKRSSLYWTPRIGIGIQKSPYIELGVSRLHIPPDKMFASDCIYSSIEVNRSQAENVRPYFYGIKIGYETSWSLGMLAIEPKYLTDFSTGKLILSLKAGVSLIGAVNLLYGYNIGKNLEDFKRIGTHQISIIANLNRHLINSEFR